MICPCPHEKKKYSPLLDDQGRPTDGGKCFSSACNQRFFPPTKRTIDTALVAKNSVQRREHIYHTATGDSYMRIVVQKHTDGRKKAFAERWDGTSWQTGVEGYQRLLYKLPQVLERMAQGGIICICEGEKDCDNADSIGITATCNPFGAEKWTDDMSSDLSGARVVIIPDLDEPGWGHARMVEKSLLDAGVASVGMLDLRTLMPDLPEKSDLSDYLDRNGDPELLRSAIEQTASRCEDVTDESPLPPCPQILWETLPRPLWELVESVQDERQRIALLMAAITVIGSVLPNVTTTYDGHSFSPSLYLFVVGPPASGKGIITPAVKLIMSIHQELLHTSKVAKKEYKVLNAKWKAKGPKSDEPPPDEPIPKLLKAPADSTGAALIRAICSNPTVLVFDSEGDTMSTALRPDSTDASSALRKAWHHEWIDQARVKDSHHIQIERPHLSMVLSGTPNQISALVRHVESGLTSRFCFIEFPPQKTFRDPFVEGADHTGDVAKHLQQSIYDLWVHASKVPHEPGFVVELSASQKTQHVKHFKTRFEDEIEGANEGATLRAAIVAVRIVTVLTAIRCWFDGQALAPKMIATDDDFRMALSLAEYMRQGTDDIIRRLSQEIKHKVVHAEKPKTKEWLSKLPAQFTTREAVAIGAHVGISRSTVHKHLKNEKYFETIAHGIYRKVEAPGSLSP
jgi:hypothetical protein